MKAISLIYHDVVEASDHEASGFRGADAALYKLAPDQFDAHLDAIARARQSGPALVSEIFGHEPPSRPQPGAESGYPLLLTFDDGGQSAYSEIAPRLEARGWRGHFFVTAGMVGEPAFCDAEQLKEMAAKGHLIGSHSYSHPLRMTAQSWSELVDEWQRSMDVLAEILGEPPRIASVPGGLYSRAVARAAARVGVRLLFTAEPVSQSWRVDNCRLLGRYSIINKTSARAAARIAAADRLPRYRQFALWRGNQLAKRVAGSIYMKARKAIIERLPR